LVLDELRQGFAALTSLAGIATVGAEGTDLDGLLGRAMTLPATRGAALFSRVGGDVTLVRGVGSARDGREDRSRRAESTS
jgi:hypothetical protein